VSRWKYRKDGTKFRRWSCGTASRKGAESCSVGKLLREDDALQMLKTALRSLPGNLEAISETVTTLAMEAIAAEEDNHRDLPRQIRSLQAKKEKLLDAYCSSRIHEEDMLAMKEHYDALLKTCRSQLEDAENRRKQHRQLEQDIRKEALAILTMEKESEVFCKTILDSITVFKDRSLELRLKEGLRLQDCEGDLVAAASLYAVAALLDARETSGVEEFKAGDLSVKTGGTGQERAGKALYRQAELLAKPYLADSFAFVGV
jgi:hypothetical protein